MKRRAFTLIEMLLVVSMTAIIAVTMSFSIRNVQERATFKEHQQEIVAIFQTARTLALSNLLLDGQVAEFYVIEVASNYMTLNAGFADGSGQSIEVLEFDEEFEADTGVDSATFYYFPPAGEVCFVYTCDSGSTSKTISLLSTQADYETEITIDIYGGYPEINENP